MKIFEFTFATAKYNVNFQIRKGNKMMNQWERRDISIIIKQWQLYGVFQTAFQISNKNYAFISVFY